MSDFTIPAAFHFEVSFQSGDLGIPDTAFQEVSGLETEISTEQLQEGGENRFVHNLPKQVKHPNLKLKRGLTDASSGLVEWCQKTLEGDFSEPIRPQDMVIKLLDEEAAPIASWSITNAYPVKWTVGNMDAMKNELAVETVELSYLNLRRTE